MNSLADAEKKGTFASPAVARASRVLPVPGSPSKSTPLGARAPTRRYRSGFFRKSTISLICPSTSSMPATSAKVTRTLSRSTGLTCRLMPKAPMAPPLAIRFMNQT